MMLLWHSRTITQFTTTNISLVKDKCCNAVHVNVPLKMFPSLSNLALSAQSLMVRHMHFMYIIWTINGCHYHQMSRIKEDRCVYPFCNCWPYHYNVHICHEVGESILIDEYGISFLLSKAQFGKTGSDCWNRLKMMRECYPYVIVLCGFYKIYSVPISIHFHHISVFSADVIP